MRTSKKAAFVLLLGAAQFLVPQVVKIKAMSLKEFPEISAVLSVENSWGAPVPVDYRKARLFENGRPIPALRIAPLDSQTLPVFAVIVLDRSGSMKGEPFAKAKEGAVAFVDMMRGGDQAACIVFDTRVSLAVPFSADRKALGEKITATQTGTDTALLDAVFLAAEEASRAPEQSVRIAVVLTDGRENRSRRKLDETVEKAQAAGMAVYTIGLGREIDEGMLKALARKTEANYYHAPEPSALVAIYRRISELLHAQLRIQFATPFPMDDTWHDLKVVIPYMGREIAGERAYLSARESRIPTELLKKAEEGAATPLPPTGAGSHRPGPVPYLLAVLGLLLLLLLALLILKSRKRA